MSDSISPAEREAAMAAERLLGDPYLTEAMTELQSQSMQMAVFGARPEDREEARHQAQAINRLRGALQAVVENVLIRRDQAARAARHE